MLPLLPGSCRVWTQGEQRYSARSKKSNWWQWLQARGGLRCLEPKNKATGKKKKKKERKEGFGALEGKEEMEGVRSVP